MRWPVRPRKTPIAPGQCDKQPRTADVGDEADRRLGHGEHRAFGDDAIAGVAGQADAAAHHDAVLDRDEGLGIAADQCVEAYSSAQKRRARSVPSLRA